MIKTPIRYVVLLWAGATYASVNDLVLLSDAFAKLAGAIPSQGSVLASRCVFLSYGDQAEMALMENALSKDLQDQLMAVPMSSSHNFSDENDLLNKGIDLVVKALLASKDSKFASRYQQLSPANKAKMRFEWLNNPVKDRGGTVGLVTARAFTLALLLKIGKSPAVEEVAQPEDAPGFGERIGAGWQNFKNMCARHNFFGRNAVSHDADPQTKNTFKALNILNCRLQDFHDMSQEVMNAVSGKIGDAGMSALELLDVDVKTHDFNQAENPLNQAIDTIIQYFALSKLVTSLVVSPQQRRKWMALDVEPGEGAQQFTLRVIEPQSDVS